MGNNLCTCGHPRLAHLEEQRTEINTGKVTYITECIWCGCSEFQELKEPVKAQSDDEDFARRPV